MTEDNKQNELNGADIFSDWDSLIGTPATAPKQSDDTGLDLNNLMTESSEDHWLKLFQKTNMSGMDLIALKLIPNYTHDFKSEHLQLKTQARVFLLGLSHLKRNDLRVAGLSEDQIDALSTGNLPINWTVHLKYPVAYGGAITTNNFVLMPQHPFHEEIHHFINQQIVTDAGVMTPPILYVPAPKSAVYIPFGSNEMAQQVIHFETAGGNK